MIRLALGCVLAVLPGYALGDVVVIANRTSAEVAFTTSVAGDPATRREVAPGDALSIPTRGRTNIGFSSGGKQVQYPLDANAVYYFRSTSDNGIRLHKIDLAGDASTRGGRDLDADAGDAPAVGVVPVKIFADEEEPAAKLFWERKIRKRVKEASDIFERQCRIRFEVIATGTWQTDNRLIELDDALEEFEAEVVPEPAVLAIGFMSQPMELKKGMHIGGIRRAMESHILVDEWTLNISEAERLELLVHELGHFLGAAHSPEPDSVMRPILADRLARRRDFPIRLDAVNVLAISLVAEEIRLRNARRIADFTPGTLLRLQQIYQTLGAARTKDSAANGRSADAGTRARGPLAESTRRVVQGVVRAARSNRERSGHQGDELTGYYVREAARIAGELPADLGPRAFLMGIGIAMDDSEMLLENPLTGPICRAVESVDERSWRLEVLGRPTMRGRRDLALHFVVSAYLVAQFGNRVADMAGRAKEMMDVQGGSGFSFADLAADQAGILFADRVLSSELELADLARRFSVARFMPSVDRLPERIVEAEEIERQLPAMLDEIGRRLHALPGRND